jgi:hypothetical protein
MVNVAHLCIRGPDPALGRFPGEFNTGRDTPTVSLECLLGKEQSVGDYVGTIQSLLITRSVER